jgi:hypothetical protein
LLIGATNKISIRDVEIKLKNNHLCIGDVEIWATKDPEEEQGDE